MNIKPIKNNNDYNETLKRIGEIWDAKINTKNGDELDILSTLIEKYEEKKYNILPPDPVEAIKFRMEQMNLKQKDLAKMIGKNRISEILNRKRGLSINMIKILHTNLNIPTDSLLSCR